MRKRSITIAKHRTSISLEDPFWEALRAYAKQDGRSVAELVGEIDRGREKVPAAGSRGGTAEVNLSAAIRLYVLDRTRGKR